MNGEEGFESSRPVSDPAVIIQISTRVFVCSG